jgi:hypothetical protein
MRFTVYPVLEGGEGKSSRATAISPVRYRCGSDNATLNGELAVMFQVSEIRGRQSARIIIEVRWWGGRLQETEDAWITAAFRTVAGALPLASRGLAASRVWVGVDSALPDVSCGSIHNGELWGRSRRGNPVVFRKFKMPFC